MLLIASFLLLPLIASAQQPAIHYVYDELNRLIAVIDQEGNVATYAYDATGNLLKIERFDAAAIPGPVGITLVRPNAGRVGTEVEIFGKGFGASPGQNTVAFNGVAAGVSAAAPNRILTSVPAGATTGLISVTTPLGSATSPTAFHVVGELAVSPASVMLFVTGTQQFEATEDGAPTTNVRWAVNGFTGGDATVGTITVEGLYRAPAAVPSPATVTVTATLSDEATVSASGSVTIEPPQPTFIASRAVSVGFPAPPLTVDRNVTAAVSVEVEAPPAAVFVVAAPASVSRAPVVTAVSPASGARGGADLAVTLTGAGFTGATAVTFLLNNAPDGTITATAPQVDAEGTQATVQVSITPDAALGARVVQITTPDGSSTSAGTGGNLFTVE